MENNTKIITAPKKKYKKKSKRGKSTKESTDEYISQKEPSQVCQHGGGVTASHQPANKIGNHECIRDKSVRSYSAALTSSLASQMHEFSDHQKVHNCKEHAEFPDLDRSLLQTKVGKCNSNQVSPCCKENRGKHGTEVASNNCFTFDLLDNHSTKLFKCKPCEIIRVKSCKVEDCNGSGSGNNKTSQINSHASKVHTVTTTPEDTSRKSLIVQHDMINAVSHQPSCANGKENRTFICKKNDSNVMGAKQSNFNRPKKNSNFMDKCFAVEHNKFTGERLSSTPSVCSYEYTNTGCRVGKVRDQEPFIHTRIPHRAFIRPSGCDDKQRFSGRFSRYGMPSNSCKHVNYSNARKEQVVCDQNFTERFKPDFSQKVPVPSGSCHFKKKYPARTSICNKQHPVSNGFSHLNPVIVSSCHEQQNVLPSDKLNVPGHGLLNGFREYNQKIIPRFKHSFERSSHSSSGSERCSEFNLFNFRQGGNSGASETKWIPAPARGSSMRKRTNSGDVFCDFDDKPPITRQVRNDNHPDASLAPLTESPSVLSSESECSTSCQKLTSSKSKTPNHESCGSKIGVQMAGSSGDSLGRGDKTNGSHQFVIGSHKAMEALNAAYRLQLESESFQSVVKCPLAEIEGLLHLAAPVISLSYTCEKCIVCSSNWLSHERLCKHYLPNLSIRSIWDWYEKPGSYGLQVKAEDLKSMSFHAYFAPSLSAIQLFYPRHRSYCNGNGYHVEPDLQGKRKKKFDSYSRKILPATHSRQAVKPDHPQVEELYSPEPASSLNTPPCICCCSSGMNSSPACSTDAELVFEFFESEQPQQRKPLHLKVAELIDSGTNNACCFGDTSKLESSNLHDLHPASWFSVAWYPIYRIPGGKFCASFLTYHSIGFFTQTCNGTDDLGSNTRSVVSPVLGLESYNAQDECWFRPKLSSQVNSVEVVKERLSVLEGNASHFARGCIEKDKAKVFNRQPDYEFFVSRKRTPTWQT